MSALLAVYNATTLPARDTVTQTLNITKNYFYPFDLNTIGLQVDSNYQWLKNIRNNVFPTGNTDVDYLINKYYLIKTYYSPVSYTLPYHSLSFRTDSNYFISNLCNKFYALPNAGVYSCFPDNENWSYGLDITDSIGSNFIQLTYMYGWGDCTVNCEFHRFWTFQINDNCSVQYLGSHGDPLPDWVFTGIKKDLSSLADIEIYPNPTTNLLYIKSKSHSIITEMSILTSDGQTIFSLSDLKLSANPAIDVSDYIRGMYLVKFKVGNNYFFKKIILSE